MRLTVLVVSRTPSLLSRMLDSVAAATELSSQNVEILCSWNGNAADESDIRNDSGYEFNIAQRDTYHFASNMNALADKATGEVLLLINDDVVLDNGSIDAALSCLAEKTSTGLVGARLRDNEGRLTHAGILFDRRHSPYHQLDRLVSSEHHAVLGEPRPVPAVTGAAMLIGRDHFQALRFNPSYKVCGEDVELCLALRRQLKLNVVYCPRFSGEHKGEATRSNEDGQSANSEDLTHIRGLHERFLKTTNDDQLRIELAASVIEADILRSTILSERKHNSREYDEDWENQNHALQLARLKLEQKLKQAERGA